MYKRVDLTRLYFSGNIINEQLHGVLVTHVDEFLYCGSEIF